MRNPPSRNFPLALGLQLARGAVGLLAIIAAFWIAGLHLPASAAIAVALVVVALIAWRGCPTCWLMGLFNVCSGSCAAAPAKVRRPGR